MELTEFIRKHNLFIVSGPSGAGKSTVLKQLLENAEMNDTLEFSTSATTRPPRPGEVEGVDYYFLAEEDFIRQRDEDKFLEWAKVHTAFYGTPESNLEKSFSKGKDLVLEIDVQGAEQIRKKYPDCVMLFIAAPLDEMRRRLENRPSSLSPEELEKEIDLRVGNARAEMESIPVYDYLVINENLDESVKKVISIIRAERSRVVYAREQNAH